MSIAQYYGAEIPSTYKHWSKSMNYINFNLVVLPKVKESEYDKYRCILLSAQIYCY